MEENNQKSTVKISLSEKIINSSFAIGALIFYAILFILFSFGVYSPIMNGIFSLIIVSLAVIGVLWNYIKDNKPSIEFFFSVGVLVLIFITMIR